MPSNSRTRTVWRRALLHADEPVMYLAAARQRMKKDRQLVTKACTDLMEAGLINKAWVADGSVFCAR